jgi:hypothetical protein
MRSYFGVRKPMKKKILFVVTLLSLGGYAKAVEYDQPLLGEPTGLHMTIKPDEAVELINRVDSKELEEAAHRLNAMSDHEVDKVMKRGLKPEKQVKRSSTGQAKESISFDSVSSWVNQKYEKGIKKVKRNKATYLFFGAHGLAAGALALSSAHPEVKGGIAVAALVAHYVLLGRHFKNSYYQAVRFDQETEAFEQPKILNTSNWLEKNGIVVDGEIYTRGFQLWNGYQKAPNKQRFLRHFLSVITVDSSATSTRQVIVTALEALKYRLSECSDPSHERYTNAGLLLGKFFHRYHVHPEKPYPHNISTWLWQEDRGGDLFKKPFGEAYFEEWLNPEFLKFLRVYETDPLARMFSLTEGQTTLLGFRIPWYRISSWSRNAAARYYVALLKQYVFLLACRALCDDIIASQVVGQKQDVFW